MRSKVFHNRIWVVCAPVMILCMTGCSSDRPRRKVLEEGAMYIFRDRSDAQLEHVYVLKDGVVVAQVAVFPPYKDRKWYLCDRVQGHLLEQARMWALQEGEVTPPFEPGGPWFSIDGIPKDKTSEAETLYFRNDNAKLERFFLDLRVVIVREDLRIGKLPEWIEQDERLRRQFGIYP